MTNKERSEEIKKELEIEWLFNRVEELELEINDWRAEVQKWQQFYKESEESHLETKELLKSIAVQNKRLREALEFYAGGNHYSDKLYDYKIVLLDDGEIARKALEGENNE